MRNTIRFLSVILAANCLAAGETNFVPCNPPEMKPLASHDTPAFAAAKWFQRGANLGNYLEAFPAGSWGGSASAEDFAEMKRQGFDHVRVPIGWQHYAGPAPEFALAPEIFSRVDFVVTNALKNKLAVMINIHHFDEMDKNPAAATEEFLRIWRQISAHYQKFPAKLAFELDNEPHKNATTAAMNPLYARAIAEIRQTNPRRIIFVEPGNWGGINELTNLVLPPDDRVIVSVHCYEPFLFTHQGATWTEGLTQVTGIIFPGPPKTPLVPDPSLKIPSWETTWFAEYNTLPAEKNPSSPAVFEDKLKFCRQWTNFYGRPIHLGEFGAYTRADDQSRANFYRAFRRACEREQIGWCLWDWNAGFRYWNEKTKQPMPGMRDALFAD